MRDAIYDGNDTSLGASLPGTRKARWSRQNRLLDPCDDPAVRGAAGDDVLELRALSRTDDEGEQIQGGKNGRNSEILAALVSA